MDFFFFLRVGLNSELYSINHIINRCAVILSLLPHNQSIFNIILEGAGIFRMVNEHWLQLKFTSGISA